MKRQPPPLRFLTAVAAIWICARAALLAPEWWVEQSAAASGARMPSASSAARDTGRSETAVVFVDPATPTILAPTLPLSPPTIIQAPRPRHPAAAAPPLFVRFDAFPVPALSQAATAPGASLSAPRASLAVRLGNTPRLSGSAWLLVRDDRVPALAPGGTLGGSQAGLRILYRLNADAARPLALSGRLYAPVRSGRGAEAALGLEWQPLEGFPIRVLAERRQALGRDGRSAFALALHGGFSERPLPAGLRLDAYGQAGMVGTRSRDLFADGAARVTLPVGEFSLGAGLWGGAQPGAARLDAGPHASIRLDFAGESLRLAAEWRLRVAGDASPGSGPVLSLGTDF